MGRCELWGHQASDVADMKQGHDETRFGVLIYEGVEPIDLGGTIGVMSMARRVFPAVEATVIARHAGPVRLAGGLTVLANHGVDTAPACDVVIVCGGPGWPEAAVDRTVLAYLRVAAGASGLGLHGRNDFGRIRRVGRAYGYNAAACHRRGRLSPPLASLRANGQFRRRLPPWSMRVW